jgi:hypothetical protein
MPEILGLKRSAKVLEGVRIPIHPIAAFTQSSPHWVKSSYPPVTTLRDTPISARQRIRPEGKMIWGVREVVAVAMYQQFSSKRRGAST